jgi:hypothetical protein
MERVTITEEMVKNAVSYAPVRMKEEFVEACYMRCLNKVDVSLDDKGENPMPYMYMENTFLKSRFLTAALAVMYLGYRREDLKMEDGELWLVSEEEFDRWGMSHVIGQLNRFRNNNPELKDKVFDLLRDYGDLERRLSSAVRSGLHVMNDPANRIFQKVTMDMSSDALEEQRKQLEELRKELVKKMKGEEHGEGSV